MYLSMPIRCLLVAWLTMSATACELMFDDEHASGPTCSLSHEDTAQISGSWALRAQGSRRECTDPVLNTEVMFLEANALPIRQDGNSLRLATTISVEGGSFSLTGEVAGRCVSLETIEVDAVAGTMRYAFHGTVNEAGGSFSGYFIGEGPEGCVSEGEFDVTLND